MAPFLYRCPVTGLNVQGWIADDPDALDLEERHVSQTCLACQRVHLVNPGTGKVLGEDE